MPAETQSAPSPRLLEAVVEVNRRLLAGDNSAHVDLAAFGAALPLAALTCIDARLNPLLPELLGLPAEKLVWLRNAGNIVTGPMSSTMRSLALACAVKGAREIAIIGHTECLVGKMTVMQLLERFAALGVDQSRLPQNPVEFFGLFGTERQNVLTAVDFVRASPLIGPVVPVHGLMIDIRSGRLEWLVNGYQASETAAGRPGPILQKANQALGAFERIGSLALGGEEFASSRIGGLAAKAHGWLGEAEKIAEGIEAGLGERGNGKQDIPPPLPRDFGARGDPRPTGR